MNLEHMYYCNKKSGEGWWFYHCPNCDSKFIYEDAKTKFISKKDNGKNEEFKRPKFCPVCGKPTT